MTWLVKEKKMSWSKLLILQTVNEDVRLRVQNISCVDSGVFLVYLFRIVECKLVLRIWRTNWRLLETIFSISRSEKRRVGAGRRADKFRLSSYRLFINLGFFIYKFVTTFLSRISGPGINLHHIGYADLWIDLIPL